jgi:hypothetical protein
MDFPERLPIIVSMMLFLIGFIALTIGYRVFKILIIITGAVIGLIVGGYAAANIVLLGNTGLNIALAIGAIAGACLMILFRIVPSLFAGAIAGILLGQIIISFFPFSNAILSIILAVIGAVSAVFFRKFLIIGFTSFSGAVLIAIVVSGTCIGQNILSVTQSSDFQSVFNMFSDASFIKESYELLTTCTSKFTYGWIVIAIIGIVFQLKTTKRFQSSDQQNHSDKSVNHSSKD